MRYIGGGIGHGGNSTDIETPVVPDADDEGSDEGPNKGHGMEGNDDVVGDDGASDDEDEEDGEVYIENEDSDGEEPSTEL